MKIERILVAGAVAGSIAVPGCGGGSSGGSNNSEPEESTSDVLETSEILAYIATRLKTESAEHDFAFSSIPQREGNCALFGRKELTTNTGTYGVGLCFIDSVEAVEFPVASENVDMFFPIPHEPTQEELTEHVDSIRDDSAHDLPPIFGLIPSDDVKTYSSSETHVQDIPYRYPRTLAMVEYTVINIDTGGYVTSGSVSYSDGMADLEVDLSTFSSPDTYYGIEVSLQGESVRPEMGVQDIYICATSEVPTENRQDCVENDNGGGLS